MPYVTSGEEKPAAWPPTLSPANSPVYARIEKLVNADPATVWAVLIQATEWPTWFRQVKNVRVDDGARALAPGARFRWSISGQHLRSQVHAFKPTSEIAWESHNVLMHTFHRWHLLPTANGCTVVDEECQRGLLPWAARPIQRRALHRVHQEWLENLAIRAGLGKMALSQAYIAAEFGYPGNDADRSPFTQIRVVRAGNVAPGRCWAGHRRRTGACVARSSRVVGVPSMASYATFDRPRAAIMLGGPKNG